MQATRIGTVLTLIIASLVSAVLLAQLGLAAQRTPAHASPNILYVASTGNCGSASPCYSTVQDAVDSALSGDEIRVAAGTYPIPTGSDQVVYVDKSLTIRGGYGAGNWDTADPQTNPTHLDALAQGRVMLITGTVQVTVEGLRMIHGNAFGLGGAPLSTDAGGAVYVHQATATLLHTHVLSSTASDGKGGGIYAYNGTLHLERCTIQDNVARDGGGLTLRNTVSTLTDNTIIHNTARSLVGSGGGISLRYVDSATVSRNVIRGNHSEGLSGGGGAFLSDSDVVFENNLIIGNSSAGPGSGLHVQGSSPRLYHNTIANNTDGDGHGISVEETGTKSSRVVLKNSIIVSQTIGVYVGVGSPLNTATLDGVLWWGNETNHNGSVSVINGISGNPAFADPVVNDYHIRPGSAAIDTGSDTGVTTDIDGHPRPLYGGYDLGADELWAVVTVKTAAPATAEPGEPVTYTLALTNTTDTAMVVRLTDTLPSEVKYLGPLDYDHGSGGHASGVVTWTGTVFTATPTLVSWPVQVAADVPLSTTIVNVAAVRDPLGPFQTEPSLILVPQIYYDIYLPVVLRGSS